MTFTAWLGWLLLVLPCDAAPACKCGLLSVEDQLARAEMVFSGTVLSVAESFEAPAMAPPEPARQDSGGTWTVSSGLGIGMPQRPATLAITRTWKRAGDADADSVTVYDLLACTELFQVGTEYLVYAVRRDDGRLVTSRCERSRPLAEVPDDVRLLDSLVSPRPGP
jgi:hypothetical protein